MLGLGALPVSVLATWKASLVFMELDFCSSLSAVQSLSLKTLYFSFSLFLSCGVIHSLEVFLVWLSGYRN